MTTWPFVQDVHKQDDVTFTTEPAFEGCWFRYEDMPDYGGESSSVNLRCLRVVRETPKCVVLDDWGRQRWVLKDARKRFAYPTVALARESFLKRKRHQVSYLAAQHDHARRVLAAAETHFATQEA